MDPWLASGSIASPGFLYGSSRFVPVVLTTPLTHIAFFETTETHYVAMAKHILVQYRKTKLHQGLT